MAPEEIARRFSDMATWVEGMITFDMQSVRYYREHHGVNTLGLELRSPQRMSIQ